MFQLILVIIDSHITIAILVHPTTGLVHRFGTGSFCILLVAVVDRGATANYVSIVTSSPSNDEAAPSDCAALERALEEHPYVPLHHFLTIHKKQSQLLLYRWPCYLTVKI